MIYSWQCQECGADNVLDAPKVNYLSVTVKCEHCGTKQVAEGFTDIEEYSGWRPTLGGDKV
jgi:transcription elongation factor Elf1